MSYGIKVRTATDTQVEITGEARLSIVFWSGFVAAGTTKTLNMPDYFAIERLLYMPIPIISSFGYGSSLENKQKGSYTYNSTTRAFSFTAGDVDTRLIIGTYS